MRVSKWKTGGRRVWDIFVYVCLRVYVEAESGLFSNEPPVNSPLVIASGLLAIFSMFKGCECERVCRICNKENKQAMYNRRQIYFWHYKCDGETHIHSRKQRDIHFGDKQKSLNHIAYILPDLWKITLGRERHVENVNVYRHGDRKFSIKARLKPETRCCKPWRNTGKWLVRKMISFVSIFDLFVDRYITKLSWAVSFPLMVGNRRGEGKIARVRQKKGKITTSLRATFCCAWS